MLHPDSKRRIEEIDKLASLFIDIGYPKTAREVREFAEILKGDRLPPDFLKKLDALIAFHQKEFEEYVAVGKDYRKRCFEEIRETIIEAIGRMRNDYAPALLTIYPIFRGLNSQNKVIGSIAEQLADGKLNKEMIFHLHCYAYLVLIEGVFDELARILYFLATVDRGNVPALRDLENLSVRKILDFFNNTKGITPVFLEKWEEKNHIRNSISHARTVYNPSKNEVRFVDIDPRTGAISYDSGYIAFSKFAEMGLELEDSLTAFIHIFLLLKIYDFVAGSNPFV